MELLSVIDYHGNNDTVVWKHPTVNFNNNSQLIVRESQEAIFFLNGEALDSFGPGRHTLETGKIPLLTERIFGASGQGEVFQSEVYYVNLVDLMSIKWGTQDPIGFIDKTENDYRFELGVRGELSIRVVSARKIIKKFVGGEEALGKEKLVSYIRPYLTQKIMDTLSKMFNKQALSIFEIDMHTDELTNLVKERLREEISDFGVDLSGFWITGFSFPEDDEIYVNLRSLRGSRVTELKKQKLQQDLAMNEQVFNEDYEIRRTQLDTSKEIIVAEAGKKKTIIEAQANAEKRATEGYDYAKERAYDVAEALASNDNVSNISATGVGIGMMGGLAAGVGGVMAGTMKDALNPISNSGSSETVNNLGFSSIPNPIIDDSDSESSDLDDFEKRIRMLNIMRENNAISQDEYEKKKKEILDSI